MHIEIKRICVPTDFSPSAEHAIHYGAALAEHHNAELHLLHVLQDFGEAVLHPDFTASGEMARDYFSELEKSLPASDEEHPVESAPSEDERAHEFLRSLERGVDDQFTKLPLDRWWERVRVVQATRYGNPVEEICRFARRNMIDLLVLGTHGRTGWRHVLIGSVAERVVRLSPCPVLTVRHPEHNFVVED